MVITGFSWCGFQLVNLVIIDVVISVGKTTVSVRHGVQLLLNKQQQIWGDVYIHQHFSSSTDTVILPSSFIARGW